MAKTPRGAYVANYQILGEIIAGNPGKTSQSDSGPKDLLQTALFRLLRCPDWPGRLSEEEAAAYLGLSKSGFRDKWDHPSSTYPQPQRDGGRIFWARRQLDVWIDCQFGLAQSPESFGGGGRTREWAK